MTRVNLSPGKDRDLDKPLIEIDPDAPRRVRWVQRLAKGYIGVVIFVNLSLLVVLVVVGVVLLFAGK